MKKYSLYFVIAIASICLFANCSPKKDSAETDIQKPAVSEQSKTEKDLKAAIDGEATASAKYADYAKKAAEEGLPQIEALFKATSKAEAIHKKNHMHALYLVSGIKRYKPNIEKYATKATAENLKAVIEGEKYESKTMYPTFITDAKSEFEDDAVISFKLAMGAEKNHAKLYSEALTKIKNPSKIQSVYYVCPVCGNVYAGKPSAICELCGTPESKFIKYSI
jgi:rubrerythrin